MKKYKIKWYLNRRGRRRVVEYGEVVEGHFFPTRTFWRWSERGARRALARSRERAAARAQRGAYVVVDHGNVSE